MELRVGLAMLEISWSVKFDGSGSTMFDSSGFTLKIEKRIR